MIVSDPTLFYGLESLHHEIESDPATEGLIVHILDGFLRVVHNITTSLTNFNKQFKRSELKFLHDAKPIELSNLLKNPVIYYDMDIPIPSGMKVSYLQAINTLDGLFKQLDIETTFRGLQQFFLGAKSESHPTRDPSDLTKNINNLTKDHTEKTLQTIFSSEKTLNVPLGTVIHSYAELLEIDRRILLWEQRFKSVPGMCQQLDKISQEIDRLVTDLEHTSTPDQHYVKSLYQLVRTAAVQMDMLGVLLAEMQRVEKNFVLVLKKLMIHKDQKR